METEENTDEKNNNEIYEIGYLLVPSIPEEKLAEEAAIIRGYAEQKEGVLITEELPKQRPLAYTIYKTAGSQRNRFNQAYFGWLKFELPQKANISAIKDELEENVNIIRWICIKTVRENTLVPMKISLMKKTDSPKKKKEVSEEELEKSIKKLVGDEETTESAEPVEKESVKTGENSGEASSE